ncbi:serine hydrolase [Myroides sp. M-43]|uniref:serine hydrolase domain-containing protein n=1 Tax=Myroides oncorhynchi TaxID=2893756 RepID=UPI001E2A786D|nr:serine hydrolase domain-containing protein [Myroides oncorhynchi]MCC9043805.1 serine hydrolase [Myroides oncorhynchi]
MTLKKKILLAFVAIPLTGYAHMILPTNKSILEHCHYTEVLTLNTINEKVNPKDLNIDKQDVSKLFKELSQVIDQYAQSTLKKGNINSLAITIYRDGETYQQYYGELDKQGKQKASDNTLFEIASISKTFVGSLAAKAVLEQKIKLEDDVRVYLKDEYSNLQFKGTPITIKDLLTHTLGLKNKAPKELEQVYQKVREGYYENRAFDYAMTDLLEELKTVELDKKPGTVYEYNSVGPELMAYILEQVYHKSYKELLQYFLSETDLQHTYLYEYERYKSQLAISFDENNNIAPLLKNPLLGGSHGMISTLPDLTKFMQFQLESNNPLIKESTRLLFKDLQDGDDKGYLWDVGYGQKEGAYYGKTGTSNGVQSGILICPDSKYGMILIMNNNSEEAQNDWSHLYNKIETELIMYPKINLVSLLTKDFLSDFKLAAVKYKELKLDETHYLSGSFYLNNLGYELINSNQIDRAIEIFELAISEDQNNANLYDSLGEAYFLSNNKKKALLNYQKSLELDPKNKNAKAVLEKNKKL